MDDLETAKPWAAAIRNSLEKGARQYCTAGDNVKAWQDEATRYIGIGAWQTGQNNRTSRVMGREPAAG